MWLGSLRKPQNRTPMAETVPPTTRTFIRPPPTVTLIRAMIDSAQYSDRNRLSAKTAAFSGSIHKSISQYSMTVQTAESAAMYGMLARLMTMK